MTTSDWDANESDCMCNSQLVKGSTSTKSKTDSPWWRGWVVPLAEDHRNYNRTCVNVQPSFSRKKRLTTVHSNNTRICSSPCIKFPQISMCNGHGHTRFHSREVHTIFNGTNRHFGFDFRKKGTWRYARLTPKVADHGICSTHFLVGLQSVSVPIPARKW